MGPKIALPFAWNGPRPYIGSVCVSSGEQLEKLCRHCQDGIFVGINSAVATFWIINGS